MVWLLGAALTHSPGSSFVGPRLNHTDRLTESIDLVQIARQDTYTGQAIIYLELTRY